MNLQNIFKKHFVRRAALLVEASALCLVSGSVMAAIVTSPVANLVVPATIDGIYINVVTGTTGTTPATVTGWDIDPYGPTNFGIFWPSTPATSSGGVVAAATTTPFLVMNPGDTIGPASTFSAAVAAPNPNFRGTGTNTLGFRFYNEATSAINYGYAVLQTTAPGGFPVTVVSITYENSGAAITIPTGAAPPQFAYAPASGSAVPFTGGTTIGSTGSASIAVSIGTAGSGSGASSTTTTTCTAPTAPFSGFGQSVTAVGAAASTSGGPLSGTCTLGAAQVTQTLTCAENRGGTSVARTFNLTCPAGTATPLTSTPASGSTVTLPAQTVGSPSTTASISFQNPGASAATVTCVAPAAPFSASPLSISVPSGGSATTTVSFNSPTDGAFTGTLTCSTGAQQFSFPLAGSASPVAPTGAPVVTTVPAAGEFTRMLLLFSTLLIGMVALGMRGRRG